MYSSWGTYRRGRTVAVGDYNQSSGCMWMILYLIVLISVPLMCWWAELEFYDRMVAFHEVEDQIKVSHFLFFVIAQHECIAGISIQFYCQYCDRTLIYVWRILYRIVFGASNSHRANQFHCTSFPTLADKGYSKTT